jgi:hypothetical protein
MFVKTDWPRLVQNLLWIYTSSYNENSVYWVIMNNFVITLSIGTYWNKFQLHTLYKEYIYLIIKNQKFSHAKYI